MRATEQNVTRFVSVVMGIVIGLTFLFGFGNVLALALSLGVPAYVADRGAVGRCCPTTGHGTDPPTGEQKELADKVIGYWSGFARTGDQGPG